MRDLGVAWAMLVLMALSCAGLGGCARSHELPPTVGGVVPDEVRGTLAILRGPGGRLHWVGVTADGGSLAQLGTSTVGEPLAWTAETQALGALDAREEVTVAVASITGDRDALLFTTRAGGVGTLAVWVPGEAPRTIAEWVVNDDSRARFGADVHGHLAGADQLVIEVRGVDRAAPDRTPTHGVLDVGAWTWRAISGVTVIGEERSGERPAVSLHTGGHGSVGLSHTRCSLEGATDGWACGDLSRFAGDRRDTVPVTVGLCGEHAIEVGAGDAEIFGLSASRLTHAVELAEGTRFSLDDLVARSGFQGVGRPELCASVLSTSDAGAQLHSLIVDGERLVDVAEPVQAAAVLAFVRTTGGLAILGEDEAGATVLEGLRIF